MSKEALKEVNERLHRAAPDLKVEISSRACCLQPPPKKACKPFHPVETSILALLAIPYDRNGMLTHIHRRTNDRAN